MPEAPPGAEAPPATIVGNSSPEVLKSFDDLTSRIFPADAPTAPDPGVAPPPPAAATPPPAEPAKEAKPAAPAEPADPFSPPPSVLEKKPAGETAPSEAEHDDLTSELEEAPVDVKSEAAKASWDKARAKVERLRTALRTANEKLAKGDPDNAARIADLEKRNVDLMQRLETFDAEQVPWYQENIGKNLQRRKSEADELMQMAELDPGSLRKAMALDGKERIAALDEIYGDIDSDTLKTDLRQAIAEIKSLELTREAWINDRKSNSEQRSLQERIERSKAIEGEQQRINGLTDSIVDYLCNTAGFEMLKKSGRPEDKAWDERIDGDLKQIKYLALENTNQNVLLAAIALGVEAPHYKKWAESLNTKLSAANQRIAELEGTVPGLEGRNGAQTTQATSGDTIPDTEDFASGAMRLLRRSKSV